MTAYKLGYKSWGEQSGHVTLNWVYADPTMYGVPDDDYDTVVYRELVETLCKAGGGTGTDPFVAISNRLPAGYPWATVTVMVVGDLGWRNSGGDSAAKLVRQTNPGAGAVVYVRQLGDPAATAAGIAHEFVHTMERPDGGLTGHEKERIGMYPNLMREDAPAYGRLSDARIADVRETIRRFNAGDRFGSYVPQGGGALTLGWANVGKVAFF